MDTKDLGNLSPTNFDKKDNKKNVGRKSNSKLVGDEGEKMACEYLVSKGYKIIGKNYRINFGEIDIIARKNWGLFRKNDKTIHFVEVKTLTDGNNFYPEEHVDYKKKNKYKRLAEIWLSKNKVPENTPYQIDIIAVSFGEICEPKIDYFENIVGG